MVTLKEALTNLEEAKKYAVESSYSVLSPDEKKIKPTDSLVVKRLKTTLGLEDKIKEGQKKDAQATILVQGLIDNRTFTEDEVKIKAEDPDIVKRLKTFIGKVKVDVGTSTDDVSGTFLEGYQTLNNKIRINVLDLDFHNVGKLNASVRIETDDFTVFTKAEEVDGGLIRKDPITCEGIICYGGYNYIRVLEQYNGKDISFSFDSWKVVNKNDRNWLYILHTSNWTVVKVADKVVQTELTLAQIAETVNVIKNISDKVNGDKLVDIDTQGGRDTLFRLKVIKFGMLNLERDKQHNLDRGNKLKEGIYLLEKELRDGKVDKEKLEAKVKDLEGLVKRKETEYQASLKIKQKEWDKLKGRFDDMEKLIDEKDENQIQLEQNWQKEREEIVKEKDNLKLNEKEKFFVNLAETLGEVGSGTGETADAYNEALSKTDFDIDNPPNPETLKNDYPVLKFAPWMIFWTFSKLKKTYDSKTAKKAEINELSIKVKQYEVRTHDLTEQVRYEQSEKVKAEAEMSELKDVKMPTLQKEIEKWKTDYEEVQKKLKTENRKMIEVSSRMGGSWNSFHDWLLFNNYVNYNYFFSEAGQKQYKNTGYYIEYDDSLEYDVLFAPSIGKNNFFDKTHLIEPAKNKNSFQLFTDWRNQSISYTNFKSGNVLNNEEKAWIVLLSSYVNGMYVNVSNPSVFQNQAQSLETSKPKTISGLKGINLEQFINGMRNLGGNIQAQINQKNSLQSQINNLSSQVQANSKLSKWLKVFRKSSILEITSHPHEQSLYQTTFANYAELKEFFQVNKPAQGYSLLIFRCWQAFPDFPYDGIIDLGIRAGIADITFGLETQTKVNSFVFEHFPFSSGGNIYPNTNLLYKGSLLKDYENIGSTLESGYSTISGQFSGYNDRIKEFSGYKSGVGEYCKLNQPGQGYGYLGYSVGYRSLGKILYWGDNTINGFHYGGGKIKVEIK